MIIPEFDVSTAVAVLNQTLDFTFPSMKVIGEVSEMRISKGKWLYFDIKDEQSKLKCFGTVFTLKMPIEDGMMVEIVSQPRLHNLYGFSLNVVSMKPVGEGSLKKASDLLRLKLEKEGLFAPERKRTLPHPPERIALVASGESAAYADFVKIINARWPLLSIEHHEVHVQGMQAEAEIVAAVRAVNEQADQPEALVLIRGGGSADDLSAFSTEPVTRAIASSRVPTLVAIGHEVDVSLAELAADVRASTPSNAAELLVPDRSSVLEMVNSHLIALSRYTGDSISSQAQELRNNRRSMNEATQDFFDAANEDLRHARLRLESYHPNQVLKRGYAIVRKDGKLLQAAHELKAGDSLEVELETRIVETIVNASRSK